ncbi:hypothetical protein NHQ30_011505 [Ciborinia camelliae]|nr:hypothetical protein NHQ30_011505 [Ciborinia camelliae]
MSCRVVSPPSSDIPTSPLAFSLAPPRFISGRTSIHVYRRRRHHPPRDPPVDPRVHRHHRRLRNAELLLRPAIRQPASRLDAAHAMSSTGTATATGMTILAFFLVAIVACILVIVFYMSFLAYYGRRVSVAGPSLDHSAAWRTKV